MYDFILMVCGHGDTKDQTAWSLTQCYERLPYKFTVNYIKEDALIGRSRSVAASHFLARGLSDCFIFIDTDIDFQPEEIERIYLAMKEGYDIVAGAYGLGDGSQLAIKALDDHGILLDGKIHEVKYVSTGFMGITVKALQIIKDKLNLPLLHGAEERHKCYPFFESGRLESEGIYISEDWDFCNKARQAGLKVYLHTGALVDHIKENVIVAEDVVRRVTLHSPAIEPTQQIVYDLAEYLGKPFPETRDAVFNHQGVWHNKTATDWLYELAQFNSYEYYRQQRIEPVANLAGCRILDFGCGIGTTALKLSEKNAVMGYDKNPEAIKFAEYRANKHNFINAHFTTTEPDLKAFDVIVFIDVLEHFKDLQAFLNDFGNRVKKGTRLYHFDAFFDHVTEGHYDHSAKIDEYLDTAGFIKFNNIWAVKA